MVQFQIVSSQLFNYDKIGGQCMKCSADKDVARIDKIKVDSPHFIASLYFIVLLVEHRNKNQNVDIL